MQYLLLIALITAAIGSNHGYGYGGNSNSNDNGSGDNNGNSNNGNNGNSNGDSNGGYNGNSNNGNNNNGNSNGDNNDNGNSGGNSGGYGPGFSNSNSNGNNNGNSGGNSNGDNNGNNNNGNGNSNGGYNSNVNVDILFNGNSPNGNNNGNNNGGYNSKNNCDNISSKDNEIFNDDLCGNLVSMYDSYEYDKIRQQYSTLNEDGNIRTLPTYIITPDYTCNNNDNDIKLVLDYARECDYKISIRSGGHQYNGLSSCEYLDNKCIQIDMKLYDHIDIIDTNVKWDNNHIEYNNNNGNGNNNGNSGGYGPGFSNSNSNGNSNNGYNNDKDYSYTIIEAGPGISADDLWRFFKINGIFVPTNGRASLGAQIVQGGSGNLLRFGTAADHVMAFDIILADGYKYFVTNPQYDYFDNANNNDNNNGYNGNNNGNNGYNNGAKDMHSTTYNNDELFEAVLGGGPGSFGIITNIYLRAYSDYDFHDNIYWQLEWDYSPQLFQKIGYQFTELFNSDYYRNDPNKYIGLDITDQIITYYGWWIRIDNDMKYKFNTNIIEDFRNIGYARVIVPLPYNTHANNGYNGNNNNGNNGNNNGNNNGYDGNNNGNNGNMFNGNNNGYDGNNNGNNGNNDYDINGGYNTITYNYMNYVLKDIDYWQYEQPMLNKKQYSNNNLNYDVIDIINKKVEEIYNNPGFGIRLNPGSLRITDEYSENCLAVREYEDVTAQQNRHTMFAVFMETLQYDYKMNKYSRDHAIYWMNDLFKMLMTNMAFDGYDIRRIGYTNSFDKFDMEREWEYYFENEEEYNNVRDVKTDVDEHEMFNGNDFTIPSFGYNQNGNGYNH